MDTLTPTQIKNWRRIIAMRIDALSPGAGIYAIIMPESEVIEYWKKTKAILEQPSQSKKIMNITKPKCKHENSITGNCGTYCLDCEKYI